MCYGWNPDRKLCVVWFPLCTQTFREPVSDYQVVREKAASQRRDVERALTRFMAKTGETQSLFKDDITAFPRESHICICNAYAYAGMISNPGDCVASDCSATELHPVSQRPPALGAGTADFGGDGLLWAGRPDGQRERSREHRQCKSSLLKLAYPVPLTCHHIASREYSADSIGFPATNDMWHTHWVVVDCVIIFVLV